MKLSHVRLLVTDYVACLRFYRDVLGLEVHWGDENGDYISFNTGGTLLALFRRTNMVEAVGESEKSLKASQQSSHCLIIAVDNVDATYELLKSRGIECINTPHDRASWGVRCFHLYDPDGNMIEVNKETEENIGTTLLHVRANVTDLDKAIQWYESVLGFKSCGHYPDENPIYAHFEMSEGAQFSIAVDKRVPTNGRYNFYVKDVDELWKSLKNKVEVVEELFDTPYGSRKFTILDLDGNELGFVKR